MQSAERWQDVFQQTHLLGFFVGAAAVRFIKSRLTPVEW